MGSSSRSTSRAFLLSRGADSSGDSGFETEKQRIRISFFLISCGCSCIGVGQNPPWAFSILSNYPVRLHTLVDLLIPWSVALMK